MTRMLLIDLLRSKLPIRYVQRVINNIEDQEILYRDSLNDDLEIELMILFDWEQSEEGYQFWSDVMDHLVEKKKLPPMPKEITYLPNTTMYINNKLMLRNIADAGLTASYEVDLDALFDSDDYHKRDVIFSWLN